MSYRVGGNGNFRDRIKVYMFSLSFLVADSPMSLCEKGEGGSKTKQNKNQNV